MVSRPKKTQEPLQPATIFLVRPGADGRLGGPMIPLEALGVARVRQGAGPSYQRILREGSRGGKAWCRGRFEYVGIFSIITESRGNGEHVSCGPFRMKQSTNTRPTGI